MANNSKYDDLYEELIELGHGERDANTFVLWKMGFDKGVKRGVYYGSFWITLLFLILRLLGVL